MSERNPKILKQISVKGYTTKEGRIVKSYRALRELNIPEVGNFDRVGVDDFVKKLNDIHDTFFNENGELKSGLGYSDMNDLEHATKSLFSMCQESGVDPIIFGSKDFQKRVNADQSIKTKNHIKMINSEFGNAISQLLDKQNIERTVKFVDFLQDKFSKIYNSDVERVDPFTFRMKVNQSTLSGDKELVEKTSKMLRKNVDNLNKNNGGIFTGGVGGVDDQFSMTAEMKKKFDMYGESNFNKNIGPSIFLSSIGDFDSKYTLSLDAMYKINTHLENNNIDTIEYIDGNSDNFRKILTSDLKKMEEFDGKDRIINFFKKIDAGSLIPALNVLMKQGKLPEFMLTNREVLGEAKKASDSMRQLFGSMKGSSTEGNYVYVSKNPLNILTMSPEPHIESCQSLTGNGSIQVSEFNINIPATYNNHNTNDFVVYTLHESGRKNSRISLNYDHKKDKFVSWESMKVYGDSEDGMNILNGMTKNGKDNFVILYSTPASTNDIISKSSMYNGVLKLDNEIRKPLIDFLNISKRNNDVDKLKKLYDNHVNSMKLQRSRREEISNRFDNEINDVFYNTLAEDRSMLYGSASATKTNKIIDAGVQFYKMMLSIDKMYRDGEKYMSDFFKKTNI